MIVRWIFSLLLAALPAFPAGTEAEPVEPASLTPVIVELFTSEGCSSCPAAAVAVTYITGE